MLVSEVATAAPSAVEKMADGRPAGKSAADAGEASPAALAAASTAGGGASRLTAVSLGMVSFTPSEGATRIRAIWSSPTTTRMAAVPPINARNLPTSLADPSAADASFAGATSRPACAARRAAAMKSDLPPQSGLTDGLTAPSSDSEAGTRSAGKAGLSPRAFPAAISTG